MITNITSYLTLLVHLALCASILRFLAVLSTLNFFVNNLLKFFYFQRVPTHPPVVLPLDLSDLNSIPDKIKQVLEIFDHIDILINNGGISVRSNIVSSPVDIDIKVMLVNYFGSVAITKVNEMKVKKKYFPEIYRFDV